MHLLLVFPILFILWIADAPNAVRFPVYVVIVVLWLPDLLLALRKSPPFVPTFKRDARTMLQLATIRPGETMYDAGCGDGRLVFAAAAVGAKAIGYEYSIPVFLYAWLRSFFHRNATIRYGDMWKQRYDDADIIFCYLLPDIMKQFEEIIWPQLKPGCRVVSHAFRLKNVAPAVTEKGIHLYVKK